MLNVGQKVSELRRMTVGESRRKYAEVFGEPTRSYSKEFLVRRIACRFQANAEGGLPERARRRALEIANDAALRLLPPTGALLSAMRDGGVARSPMLVSLSSPCASSHVQWLLRSDQPVPPRAPHSAR